MLKVDERLTYEQMYPFLVAVHEAMKEIDPNISGVDMGTSDKDKAQIKK